MFPILEERIARTRISRIGPLNHLLTRPSATLSPTGGEGRVRGQRVTGGFMESLLSLRGCIGTMNPNTRSAKLQLRVIRRHRAELELRAPIRFMESLLSLRACIRTLNLWRRASCLP